MKTVPIHFLQHVFIPKTRKQENVQTQISLCINGDLGFKTKLNMVRFYDNSSDYNNYFTEDLTLESFPQGHWRRHCLFPSYYIPFYYENKSMLTTASPSGGCMPQASWHFHYWEPAPRWKPYTNDWQNLTTHP